MDAMGTHFLFVAQDDPWQDILYAADAGGFCEVPLSLLRRLRKEGEVHKGSDEAERGFRVSKPGWDILWLVNQTPYWGLVSVNKALLKAYFWGGGR